MTQVVAIFAARTGRIGRFVWSGWAGLAALFLSCALWQAGHEAYRFFRGNAIDLYKLGEYFGISE